MTQSAADWWYNCTDRCTRFISGQHTTHITQLTSLISHFSINGAAFCIWTTPTNYANKLLLFNHIPQMVSKYTVPSAHVRLFPQQHLDHIRRSCVSHSCDHHTDWRNYHGTSGHACALPTCSTEVMLFKKATVTWCNLTQNAPTITTGWSTLTQNKPEISWNRDCALRWKKSVQSENTH